MHSNIHKLTRKLIKKMTDEIKEAGEKTCLNKQ